ncbi:MAG: hypothetical protein J0I09_03945 [Sphingobacteriia bacterium]|nr:hypothetical protein [Sphingobacteriia bacterium]
MRLLLIIIAVCIVFLSCNKDNVKAGSTVEIYLLKSFQTLTGKCQIDASTASLQDTAIIRNQDILEYSQTNYQFKLTDTVIQKIKTFKDFTPFAVTVDKQVIYYGFFKPSISSSACFNSITMDLDWTSGNKINLKLGYPGQLQGVTIDDERNNPKLIITLGSQGKLK